MANHYHDGDLVRCTGTLSDSDGVAQDPAAVLFKFTTPSGTTTTYTYGTDAELVKSATGIYYVDVDGNAAGAWPYTFYATGSGQSAAEAFFHVEASKF